MIFFRSLTKFSSQSNFINHLSDQLTLIQSSEIEKDLSDLHNDISFSLQTN
jgi:hypothetical protein